MECNDIFLLCVYCVYIDDYNDYQSMFTKQTDF